MTYKPAPADTGDVVLDESLQQLMETIARDIHEQWAKSRMDDGWLYGPERNDEKKLHPCLVPYEELPETEKEYDRNSALATLKLITKFGFRILPPEEN